MKRLAAVLSLAVLSACASAPAQQADIALPAAFHDGMVYVQVSVNGAAPVWMDLDDGTSPSAIDLDYARSLGLALKPGAGSGTGIGTERVEFFNTSADLAAGAVSRKIDFSASRLKGMVGPDGKPLMGVLGYSFLAGRILVIDYPNQKVIFAATSKPCACDLPMGLDTNIPTVPVTIAGHRMTALIDSGGMYDLLATPAAVRLAGLETWAAQGRPVTGYGYAGAQGVKIGQAPDVAVGAIRKETPETVYGTFGTSPLKAEAALGARFLEGYRVTLNYRARTVRIEP
ncbi:aspartyl protease family protein [Asticcacaulis solisilvae]|uniref:aspartyl protease family protein n=1 Tax=Asticcacaulis solisilvae TaxID=1217274 RepID=UPI003FD8B8C0